jgi:hypothetical protein
MAETVYCSQKEKETMITLLKIKTSYLGFYIVTKKKQSQE